MARCKSEMIPSWSGWYWKLGLASLLAISRALADGNYALAQIRPDNTLGAEPSVVTPNVVIRGFPSNRIDGGARRGANLFHSFLEFNVRAGRGVYFTKPVGIENIISRVTGSNPSDIEGKLGVLGGSANLFLINPNGIIFGPNASLDVGGSFVASTASSLKFADGTEFRATSPSTTSLLTISVPIGLQFSANSGSILNQSQAADSSGNTIGLQIMPGNTLALVGGDVSLDGGTLKALGGRVELGGLAGAGMVGLNVNSNELQLSFPDGVARSNVSLTNGAQVNVRAGGGGSIAITAQNLNLAGGSVLRAGIDSMLGGPGSKAGDINLNASGAITLTDGSFISNAVLPGAIGKGGNINATAASLSLTNAAELATSTSGNGDAGSVIINAIGPVSFDGVDSNGFPSGALSQVFSRGVGKGGSINVTAGSLSLTNGAVLTSSTSGNGDAGNVTITANGLISLDGVGSGTGSQVGSGALGKGGSINVTAGSLSLTNSAVLTSSTSGNGDAGNVTITANGLISLDGVGSGTGSQVGSGALGKGGSINVTAGSLSLTNGAVLISSTSGNGDAGNVTITANGLISLDGVSSDVSSQVDRGAVGNGGNINVTAGSLSLTNGARLNSSTFGQGNTGSVTITASGPVSFDGLRSGVFSQVSPPAIGKGGEINITAGSLSLTNSAELSTNTFGRGDAGSVTINVGGLVFLDGLLSGVFSLVEPGAMGKGGDINVTAGSLSLTNGARLSDDNNMGNGDAGNVTITASGPVSLTNGAELSTNTFGQGNAGNLKIIASGPVSFDGVSNGLPSGVSSQVDRGAVGNGGNINVTAGSLSLTNGALLSNNTLGNGDAGRVTITASGPVSFDGVGGNGFPSGVFSTVEAGAMGKGGDINVTAGSLSLTNGARLSNDTFGQGNAGNLTITASGPVSFDGVSNEFSSGAFSTVASGAVGKGGDINVTAGSLSLTNGAGVTVSSQGQGNSGNLQVKAGTITLDRRAFLLTQAASQEGGNIRLKAQDLLLLRRNSQISATAGTARSGGNGGNITLNTPLLVAIPQENSDISANAFTGNGGQVTINTTGIFGTGFEKFDTSGSEITASSQFGVNGTVNINTPNVNPTNGLVTLPAVVVDRSRLIAQSCGAGEGTTANEFTVTGRGGLPTNPGEVLSRNVVLEDTRLPGTTTYPKRQANVTAQPSSDVVNLPAPATGVMFNGKGQVTLIAQAPTAKLNISWIASHPCNVK